MQEIVAYLQGLFEDFEEVKYVTHSTQSLDTTAFSWVSPCNNTEEYEEKNSSSSNWVHFFF